MEIMTIALGVLAVMGIVATIVTLRNDGYRRIPTRRADDRAHPRSR